MRSQRFLLVLTLFNLLLLLFNLSQTRAVVAQSTSTVLRGRALEIVDDRGRVRASIKIQPADPDFKMPDGTVGYPETVLLRLMDPRGRPNIKIGASIDGSGLLVAGNAEPTHVQILAQDQSTSLKLINKDGRERVTGGKQDGWTSGRPVGSRRESLRVEVDSGP
jgi:hypothetical protein